MNTDDKNMTTQDLIKHLRELMPLGPQIATLVNVAADRLEELQRLNDSMQVDRDLWIKVGREKLKAIEMERDEARAAWQVQRANKNTLADLAVAIEQRDEARADVERLKAELHDTIDSYKLNNLQPKTTRPEPSRLEIAAMAMQGFITSSGFIIDLPKNSLEYADALIAAAKEAK